MNNKRYNWLDSAKTIGILLVVLGHIPSEYGYKWAIFLFHMPLFFMLSGYLYKFVDVKSEFKRCCKSLLIPYLIYSLALFGLWVIGKRTFDIGLLSNILTSNQNAMISVATSMCPLWFIVSLMIMRLVASGLGDAKLKNTPPICLCMCLIASGVGLFASNDWFKIGSTLLCLPFFIFGIWLKQDGLVEKVVSKDNAKLKACACVMITGAALYEGYCNGAVDCIQSQYGDSLFTFYCVGTILSLMFICLCRILLNFESKVLRNISQGTLLILSVHYAMIGPLNSILGKYNWGFIAIATIIMLVCYILILFCKRWMPVLIGKWK